MDNLNYEQKSSDTRRYKGQILTAIGVDCNNQIIPLAFAFVENENLDSWYWFLERVKVHVVAARPDVPY